MALAGIPSVPSQTPTYLVAFLRSVRDRLLNIPDAQFTTAEANRLKALLRSGNQETVTQTTTVAAGPKFVGIQKFHETGGGDGWVAKNATEYGVPAGASAIIVQVSFNGGAGAQVGLDAYIRTAEGEPEYTMLHSFRDVNDDVVSGQQGIYPVGSDGSFQVKVSQMGGFSCVMTIIGYFEGTT